MQACHVVEIVTPKKFALNGLWFGPRRPKRAIVWTHGLGSSAFSMSHVVRNIADAETAVVTFNNRGHDIISNVSQVTQSKKITKRVKGGAAHEIFSDCVDDIQGVINFAKKTGVKDIYLAGHSTGCQKSVYWASRNNGGKGVKGIILLAPVSDYAGALHTEGKKKVARATAVARAFVRRGKKHQLLPANLWHEAIDAQRFLSLYTPDSIEEIFTYAQPKKNPRILKSVRVPLLVLLAEKDEYGDRPAKKISEWFGQHVSGKMLTAKIIPKVPHSFHGAEKNVAAAIRKWIVAH